MIDRLISARFRSSRVALRSAAPWSNPVFELDASYAITKHWSVGFDLTYIPLTTNLTAYGTTANGMQVVSKAKLRINLLNTPVLVGYTF